jgi:hypothetical protein
MIYHIEVMHPNLGRGTCALQAFSDEMLAKRLLPEWIVFQKHWQVPSWFTRQDATINEAEFCEPAT